MKKCTKVVLAVFAEDCLTDEKWRKKEIQPNTYCERKGGMYDNEMKCVTKA